MGQGKTLEEVQVVVFKEKVSDKGQSRYNVVMPKVVSFVVECKVSDWSLKGACVSSC
jgi:hypothetical protein